MSTFRRKPNIRFGRPRAVTPGGAGSNAAGLKATHVGPNSEPLYGSATTPASLNIPDTAGLADQTFVNVAGVLSKARQMLNLANTLPKKDFIPVSENAVEVLRAVAARDPEHAPEGDKIYWDLFVKAIDKALNQYNFVNLEFLDNLQGEPFADSMLTSMNWDANNLEDSMAQANRMLSGEDAGFPGDKSLREAMSQGNVPLIAKVLSLGAPLVLLFFTAWLVKPFQAGSDQAMVGGKQPPGVEWPKIVLQIVIGMAIFIFLHRMRKEDARRAFAVLVIPGISPSTMDKILDDAYDLANGKEVDGKKLEDYPIGVSKEFLRLAMAQMGRGDWEIIRDYAVSYLLNHIEDDRYFAWNMYLDGKIMEHDLEGALKVAPYYSPLFRQHAAANNYEIKHGGGYGFEPAPVEYKTSFVKKEAKQYFASELKEGAKDVLRDVAGTAMEGLTTRSGFTFEDYLGQEGVTESELDPEHRDQLRKQYEDEQAAAITMGDPDAESTKWLNDKAKEYGDKVDELASPYRRMIDKLADLYNKTMENIMALLASNEWLKEFICCFIRAVYHFNPTLLKNLKLLLEWSTKKIEFDLGGILKKLYDKYWVGTIQELQRELHALLDDKWQKVLKKYVEPAFDALKKQADENIKELTQYCFLLDMFIKYIMDALAKFKANIDELLDSMFDGMVYTSELFNTKFTLWGGCSIMAKFARILDLAIDLSASCGIVDNTEALKDIEDKARAELSGWISTKIGGDGDPAVTDQDALWSSFGGTTIGAPDDQERRQEILDMPKAERPHNTITAFGAQLDVPAEYNRATKHNSWWFGEVKELDNGFPLLPIGAILEGRHKDERLGEEQKRRCRDIWAPDALLASFTKMPTSVVSPNLTSRSLETL